MYKNWFTADEITEEINALNVTKKLKSKKRIQEILKKIEKKEKNNELFKIKKSPKPNGKGRKILLYNENFLQRVIEYYHKDYYFTDNQASKNIVNKLLITPKTIENFLPPNVKRHFTSPQEKINFERNVYNSQLKLSFFIKNKLDENELKIQKLKKKEILQDYKENTLKILLSIKNIDPNEKIELINKLFSRTTLTELSILQKEIKRLKFQKDKIPYL